MTAKNYARTQFDQYRGQEFEGKVEASEGIAHAKGVAQILRENVVQGSKESAESSQPFSQSIQIISESVRMTNTSLELNLHEQIERGDNESIKQFKGTGKSFKGLKK